MEHTNLSTRSYSNDDVYYCCEGCVINVPFSWEHKPGLSKVSNKGKMGNNNNMLVLQPPPCSSYGTRRRRRRSEIMKVGEPNSLRISSNSFGMVEKLEDPFVEAYKRCTKIPFKVNSSNNILVSSSSSSSSSSWPNNIRKYMHIFSCKYAGDVSCGNFVYTYKM
ncbi:hypothetical protein HN51_017497 [Arachis hypogaea]